MNTLLISVGIPVAIFFVTMLVLGLIIARMYRKTTPDVALVRTGAGGLRVISNGGALIIPMMHEVTPVNMNTLGLEVGRVGADALITKNRMRVDVGAKFFIRVKPDADGIERAAQTLGPKTFDEDALRAMVEDKLVDALRAVAAKMTLDELHENRTTFVQQVQEAVTEDLLQNGLELETVSLTALDQTPFSKLDENNIFNAVGMREVAQIVATSKQERAAIESTARVNIAETEREAAMKELAIAKTTTEAQIAQDQALKNAQVAADAEIARAATAARQAEELAVIAKEQAVAVAQQERQIEVNQKSMEESRARADADTARAEAAKAEELVNTARQVAVADRQKQISLIAAEEQAEKAATGVRVAAAAEKAAARDRADAVLIEAEAQATAKKSEAAGILAVALAEAEGKAALVEANNTQSPAVIDLNLQLARLEALPRIVAEMVRPAEHIDSITLHNVTGLGGSMGGVEGAGTGGGAAGGITDALMSMALQYPALKALGDAAGVNIGNGLAGVLDAATTAPTAAPAPVVAATTKDRVEASLATAKAKRD